MLTSKQRAYLRGLANSLDSIFQVGKSGVTPELVEAVQAALEKRELVKITLLKSCEEDLSLAADKLSKRTRSEIVQLIGRRFTLYRAAKEPKIELPKA